MCRFEELKAEYERIIKGLELHNNLLSTLLRIKSETSCLEDETSGLEEVIKGEARIIAIFNDRRKKLEESLY
ncbi:MAG: hypothetical protein QXJ68_07505 [Methanocellales archaeon]